MIIFALTNITLIALSKASCAFVNGLCQSSFFITMHFQYGNIILSVHQMQNLENMYFFAPVSILPQISSVFGTSEG